MYTVKYRTVEGQRKHYLAQDKHPVPTAYVSEQVQACLSALDKMAARFIAPVCAKPVAVVTPPPPKEDPAFKFC